METAKLNYVDEMLDFIDALVQDGITQFQVVFNATTEQWDVTYPKQTIVTEG